MLCFEHAFHIVPPHSLEQVKRLCRRGVVMEVHWEHREYTADSHLVARYESYQALDSEKPIQQNGWSKFVHDGRLIDRGHFIVSGSSTNMLDEA
ncbi:hypothetical protein MicloDRAFT_00029420 [Microvirga lotononidis]|uniref:Uncharacterized protein n=1 Tax=Microvirga lotononidis TaxID=864069 RepID=I4YR01_9HYPH|nr:hypothetical protein MicloDRAFT_00029420 [Microvirga lotononidis]